MPYHHYVDNDSPRVKDELSETNVIEVQNPPDDRMDQESQADMENGLIKSHLAWVSRQYSLVILGDPSLYPRRKRA